MDFGDFGRRRSRGFGGPIMHSMSGPLAGGGAAQVGILAAKLLGKTRPSVNKYAGLIGAVVGSLASAALIATGRKDTGYQALATALVVGVPRQIEDMLAAKGILLGVTVPEQVQMLGYGFGDPSVQIMGAGGPVELLDSGSGSTGVFGVTVPEEIQPMAGAGDVELLGGGGFGATPF